MPIGQDNFELESERATKRCETKTHKTKQEYQKTLDCSEQEVIFRDGMETRRRNRNDKTTFKAAGFTLLQAEQQDRSRQLLPRLICVNKFRTYIFWLNRNFDLLIFWLCPFLIRKGKDIVGKIIVKYNCGRKPKLYSILYISQRKRTPRTQKKWYKEWLEIVQCIWKFIQPNKAYSNNTT